METIEISSTKKYLKIDVTVSKGELEDVSSIKIPSGYCYYISETNDGCRLWIANEAKQIGYWCYYYRDFPVNKADLRNSIIDYANGGKVILVETVGDYIYNDGHSKPETLTMIMV